MNVRCKQCVVLDKSCTFYFLVNRVDGDKTNDKIRHSKYVHQGLGESDKVDREHLARKRIPIQGIADERDSRMNLHDKPR